MVLEEDFDSLRPENWHEKNVKGFATRIIFKKETIFDQLKKILKSNQFIHLFGEYEHPVIHNRSFSLKQLARTKIYNSGISYHGISKLEIPKKLCEFLKEQKFYTKENISTTRIRLELVRIENVHN